MTKTILSDFSDGDSVEYNLDEDIKATFARLRAVLCEEAALRKTLDALLVKRSQEATQKLEKDQRRLQLVNEDEANIRHILRQESVGGQELEFDGEVNRKDTSGDKAGMMNLSTTVDPTPDQPLGSASEGDGGKPLQQDILEKFRITEPDRIESNDLKRDPDYHVSEFGRVHYEPQHPHREDEDDCEAHSRSNEAQRRGYERADRLHEMDHEAADERIWEAALAAAIQERRAEQAGQARLEELEMEQIRLECLEEEDMLFREIQRMADEEAASLEAERLEEEIRFRLEEEEEAQMRCEEQEMLEAEMEEYCRQQQEEEEQILGLLPADEEEAEYDCTRLQEEEEANRRYCDDLRVEEEAEQYHYDLEQIQLKKQGLNQWREEEQKRMEEGEEEAHYHFHEYEEDYNDLYTNY